MAEPEVVLEEKSYEPVLPYANNNGGASFYTIKETPVGRKISVKPHIGQYEALTSTKRFVFIIAGTQSGKTSFTPFLLQNEINRAGEGDYLAVTSTYDLFKLKFLPEMKRFFCETFGWEFSASEHVIYRQYKPRMFTRIILRSATASGGLESATAKGAILDECGQDEFSLQAWEAVQRRLSLSRGRVFGTTTPYNLGWLKTEVYDRWRKGDPDYHVIQFRSTMNPAFPMEEYERAKRTLPSWKFEMFYNGEFSRPAGMIYEDFSERHKIPPFTIPLTWPRYLGVDFGAVHNAKIWIAKDPASGLFYAYREKMEGNKTTSEHVKQVNDFNEKNLIAWGGAKSEQQQRRDWSAEGLSVAEPKISDVEAGIDRVTELLKTNRLYIFNDLSGLIDEFGTYSRELDPSGQPTEKIKNKNTYHHLDALRYVCSGIIDGVEDFSDLGNVPNFESRWK